ncbi:amidohydrolase [Clostridium sp. MB40-C1]|uniref:amidohydrolase n=1 Tax=Clostridium sp. MB40-C1 TaxID=3070996 RepID=UPI0027DF82E0|nr:amidohydrolase [Clostridium sp. MB40-C1]WMJ81755.1 amidohydrolase [Clostridium sp. MB40-C1]
MDIKDLTEKYEDYIVKMRREFHQNPEPSWGEVWTTKRIKEELESMGIEAKTFDRTGLIGTLKGRKSGKMVGLRADIDALSIEENTDLSFKSNNKFMHACGHDCHIAMLLGAAKILCEIKDELDGDVRFIFEPSEEIAEGAKYMIKNGALDGVSGILGMHIWGNMEAPKINIEKGPRMSSGDIFKIKVKGVTAHGSQPHSGVDAIVTASAIVMNLQSIVSRETNPLEPVVISIGTIKGGDRFNIIPDEVVMEGSPRVFNLELRNQLEEKMRRVIENTAEVYRAKAELEYIYATIPTINDANISKIGHDSVEKLYGEDGLISMEKMTTCDDFCFYGQYVPAAYAFIGGGNKDKGLWYSNHSDKFDIDEAALPRGAALYAQFAVDFLKR